MKSSLNILFTLLFFVSSLVSSQENKTLDSINKYYLLTKDDNISVKERLQFAKSAKSYADSFKVDSIKLRVQRQLAYMYFKNEMYEPYTSLNKDNLKLAEMLNDTSAITTASNNLGSYYRYIQQNDSSFYYYSKALDFFKKNEVSQDKAKALLYVADIQQIEKAYAGSEDDAIRAIKILNQLPQTEENLQLLWDLYNLLAIISESVSNQQKSIEYYNKSISISEEMKDGFSYEISSINNKADAYREFKQYSKAIELYDVLINLREEYENDEPDFYPTLLINIAKTKFESGEYEFNEIENGLSESYKLFKDLDNPYGVMAASLELSRLYGKYDDIELAKKYGQETLNISKEVSDNEYKMDSWLVLSELYENNKGKDYLKQYIKLSDSLQKVERLSRNKFARVKFETDELEAENKEISRENLILFISLLALFISGVLIYIILSQRAKNKELKLVQEQQKANEEIYNLMLGQQDKVEEARSQEKVRVSKELHDGVLGRLFGVRLSLDSLNFTEGKEAITNRANYIGQLKIIEDDIRKISHEMNTDFVSGSGFMDIVSELIENQSKAYGFTHEFNYTDDFSWEFVSNKTKINIYRILQESLQNIYKHAEAKHVKIDVLRENDKINIYIVDDGKGFDTSKSKKGIGLKNMNSRVEDINGEITHKSKVNNGTTVHVKIPYKV